MKATSVLSLNILALNSWYISLTSSLSKLFKMQLAVFYSR